MRARRTLPALLLTPAGTITLVAFLLPMAWLARLSLSRASGGVLIDDVALTNYVRFFSDRFYLGVLWRSVWIAAGVAVLSILASYPIALFLFRSRSRWRGVLAVLVIAPLLVSSVVRTFGWMIILGDRGWINGMLAMTGLITAPVRLMNTVWGVLIGLTEIMMPTTTLALLAGFSRLDATLEEAARSLGAAPWRCFLRVTLPLTMPGIIVAGLVTFVLSISSFVTPSLLGGGRVQVLASTIYEEALETLDWPFAAAVSVILVLVFGLTLLGYERMARRWQ
ncbi:ABC transporter permease [Limobrevibacterium gyesilva]|uniref:ABC transporter permease n=1 Tax=Limobrevibacterium gyesilva TaxID=2991712 RepID=A0AA42CEB2_9PROT|nr:ABC transporter permease [Limobrevibacterium gyesilva]MCW3475054.1 ABC transporter permease [Limobrevibacterium gyesilva]